MQMFQHLKGTPDHLPSVRLTHGRGLFLPLVERCYTVCGRDSVSTTGLSSRRPSESPDWSLSPQESLNLLWESPGQPVPDDPFLIPPSLSSVHEFWSDSGTSWVRPWGVSCMVLVVLHMNKIFWYLYLALLSQYKNDDKINANNTLSLLRTLNSRFKKKNKNTIIRWESDHGWMEMLT